MLIYKCLTTDSTAFTDAYKPEFIEDICAYKVHAKMTSKKADTVPDSMIGGNASQEEASEQYIDPEAETGLDIVLCYHYTEASYLEDPKNFQMMFKSLVKGLMTKHEGDIGEFKKGAAKFLDFAKRSLKKGDGCFYSLDDADSSADQCWPLCVWDGDSADFYYFKYALYEQKL